VALNLHVPTRPAAASVFHLYLYRRPLHPGLFNIKGRRPMAHNAYELEAWILPGGHLMRFKHGTFCCCELLVDHADHLPVDGAVTGLPCTGEQDFEHAFGAERVKYITSLQTETLSDSIYKGTYQEIMDLARENDALSHTWTDEQGRRNASVLDVQKLGREVHAQAFHLIAASGLVIRTQTIFEHA
jgi:hypothetical protein